MEQGIAFYAHPRGAAYARWYPLPLTAWRCGWWRGLAVTREIEVWHESDTELAHVRFLCWLCQRGEPGSVREHDTSRV